MPGKTPVDIVTLAIPRLVTERCIRSFLDHWADREDYCARWIFHLDQYPGLEQQWTANREMAAEMAKWFDIHRLIYSADNRGLGASYRLCFDEVSPEHNLLIIEDDWLWEIDWRLADVEEAADDAFSFCRQTWKVGGTSPSFWRPHVLRTLLNEYPTKEPIRELSYKRILARKHAFRHGGWGNVPRGCCREIGRDVLKEMGYTENFAGRSL